MGPGWRVGHYIYVKARTPSVAHWRTSGTIHFRPRSRRRQTPWRFASRPRSALEIRCVDCRPCPAPGRVLASDLRVRSQCTQVHSLAQPPSSLACRQHIPPRNYTADACFAAARTTPGGSTTAQKTAAHLHRAGRPAHPPPRGRIRIRSGRSQLSASAPAALVRRSVRAPCPPSVPAFRPAHDPLAHHAATPVTATPATLPCIARAPEPRTHRSRRRP